MSGRIAAVALAGLLVATPARAAFVVTNTDGPGEGLNDPTPVTPVGGNPATTLGAQRSRVLERAAAVWSAALSTAVDVEIDASFDPLPCTAISAVLGQGGSTGVTANFAGSVPDTWYPAPLANQIAGTDLNGATAEVELQLSLNLGTASCFDGRPFYLGLDGAPPVNSVDLLSVAIHELAHGLGFFTVVDLASGARPSGMNDVFMVHLEDHSSGRAWAVMTNAERAASATDSGDLHWTGARVVAMAPSLLSAGIGGGGHVRMNAPGTLSVGSSVSHFDPVVAPDQALEPDYDGPTISVGLSRFVLEDIGWAAIAAGSCGDGVVDSGEECDDGGIAGGDCCSAACEVEALGTTCRSSAGACDRAETCDGVSGTCPLDQVSPAGASCRASAGVCDRAETCDGVSGACPVDQVSPAGTSCRASAGVCDRAETCDGVSGACPLDQVSPAGTSCRASAGVCDRAETCDGVSGACPVDQVSPVGTSCRASAGVCDRAETCDGVSGACPLDQVSPAGTSCRASAGVCDSAETCDGVSGACPLDQVSPAGTSCRASAGVCDPAEACDGASRACPPDQRTPDGTPCPNGQVCDGTEICRAGTCTPTSPLLCDDLDTCTTDTCTEPGGCATTPIPGCCNTDADCPGSPPCLAGTCRGGTCTTEQVPGCCETDVDCDDNFFCTFDFCDTGALQCINFPVPDCCSTDTDCDDGVSCTTDDCEESNGTCSHVPLSNGNCCADATECDDNDVCTVDRCSLLVHECRHRTLTDCCRDDSECTPPPCTTSSCELATNTCTDPLPIPDCCELDSECDDLDGCTIDQCLANICVSAPIPGCKPDAGTSDGGPILDAGMLPDAGTPTTTATITPGLLETIGPVACNSSNSARAENDAAPAAALLLFLLIALRRRAPRR